MSKCVTFCKFSSTARISHKRLALKQFEKVAEFDNCLLPTFLEKKSRHFNLMCQTKGLIGKQPKASRKFNHQISTEFNLSNLFLTLKLYAGKLISIHESTNFHVFQPLTNKHVSLFSQKIRHPTWPLANKAFFYHRKSLI